MDEAQYLAREVAVIAAGRIVAQGPPASLAGRDTAATTITFIAPAGAGDLPPTLASTATVTGGSIEIRTADPTRALHELTGWALDHGMALDGLSVSRPSLEDVYLEITKSSETIGTAE
jgi:ABC-2 type transport system ATP-binding protein